MYYGILSLLLPIFIFQSAFLFPNYDYLTQPSVHVGSGGVRRWMCILSPHTCQAAVSDAPMSCHPNHCERGS